MKRCLAMLLFVLVSVAGGRAQDVGRTVSGDGTVSWFHETEFRGAVADSATREALSGAVISVVSSERDGRLSVRNYVTDKEGRFRFACRVGVRNRMEVSFLGYKLLAHALPTDAPECDLGTLWMTQDALQIDDVVVRTRIQMFRIRGDTVLYLPRAVKTMEGDAALEILRHMPGVEVSADGHVSVMGKPVERTYVNSRLLFGEDPTVALKQLDASEVAAIQSYDEADEEEALTKGRNARKRKVLNVVTFKEFSRSLSANVVAEGGADFVRDASGDLPGRYHFEGGAGYYSEKWQVSLNGKTDNRLEPGFDGAMAGSRRISGGGASVAGPLGAVGRFNVGYDYDNSHRKTSEITRRDYFPTAYFAAQQALDTTRTDARSDTHRIRAGYTYREGTWSLNSTLLLTSTAGDDRSQYLQGMTRDEAPLMMLDRAQHLDKDRFSTSLGLSASKRFLNNHSMSLSAQFQHASEDETTLRAENQRNAGESAPSLLHIGSENPYASFTGNLGYVMNFERAGALSLRGVVIYSRTKDRVTADDLLTGLPAPGRNDDYLDKMLRAQPSIGYQRSFDHSLLSLTLSYAFDVHTFEDRLRGKPSERRLFHAPQLSATYEYTPSTRQRLQLSFLNLLLSPGGSQFTTRIDDSNPLLLRAGDPSLRPQMIYDLSAEGHLMGRKQSSVTLGAQVRLTQDAWLDRRLYFDVATPLDAYGGYVVPAGATLVRPANGDAVADVDLSVGYKTRIAPLHCFVQLKGTYHFRNPQEETNGRTERAKDRSAALEANLTTNFSPDFRLSVQSRSEYRWYRNSLGTLDEGFTERLTASLRWDFLSSFFFTSSYTMSLYRNSFDLGPTDGHVLNLSLGYRLLDRRGSLSFNAYDVLNRSSSFSAAQSDQFVTYRWQRMNVSYFTFAFEYRFNGRE